MLPDIKSAKAWLEQAQCDFIATQMLLGQCESENRVCAHVCFLAHQVAEKALKAGMYKLFGLQSNLHHLRGYATSISQKVPSAEQLQELATTLDHHYIASRYPDSYCPPSPPSHHYTIHEAREAEKSAQMILRIVKGIVEQT